MTVRAARSGVTLRPLGMTTGAGRVDIRGLAVRLVARPAPQIRSALAERQLLHVADYFQVRGRAHKHGDRVLQFPAWLEGRRAGLGNPRHSGEMTLFANRGPLDRWKARGIDNVRFRRPQRMCVAIAMTALAVYRARRARLGVGVATQALRRRTPVEIDVR